MHCVNWDEKDVNFGKKLNVLILDNASWRKVKSLDWGRFEPLHPPAYTKLMD